MLSYGLHPEFDCNACTLRMKANRGCEEEIPEYEFYGMKLTRCHRRPHLDDPLLIQEMSRYHNWYSKGHLPSPGTWMDQTETFIAFMEAMDSAISTTQQELHERQMAEHAANAARNT